LLSITLSDSNDYGKRVISNQIKFSIERTRKNSKDAFWIQLLELDENGGEDIPGFSPLRYFFDDDITITDDKKTEYQIAAGIESENKIVLKRKAESKKGVFFWEQPCFPPENSTLTVRVNTYSLRKQKESISTLLQMPVGEQSKLIKLFENRDRTEWQEPERKRINDWFVITDETRSGCVEQRKFISQAINTPDFAILEGPPGSGKTTVILELICQLAKQGKRVLLCGSTHVAIDNVLERLKEHRNGTNLLEQLSILPVRIGDEKRINEDIREFQINNLM
jgi:primosomal protein N'